jgi:hypothetical protein
VIGHIGGLPVEETIAQLAGGGVGAVVAVRLLISWRVRERLAARKGRSTERISL